MACGIIAAMHCRGMKKNERLARILLRQPRRMKEHDRRLRRRNRRRGLDDRRAVEFTSAKALELFVFGQRLAAERGLILVDTKYEFGRIERWRDSTD